MRPNAYAKRPTKFQAGTIASDPIYEIISSPLAVPLQCTLPNYGYTPPHFRKHFIGVQIPFPVACQFF